MPQLDKNLLLSQVALFSGLLICLLIMPSVAVKNGGVSNFGNHLSTIVPYVLAFLLNSFYMYMASRSILKINSKLVNIAWSLVVLSLFTLLVLISTFPRHLSFTYSDIHDDLGIALYSFEFLVSLWIIFKHSTKGSISLLFMQVIGSMIGLLSIMKIIHFLFVGQLVGALGFGLLLVTILPKIIKK